MTASLFGMKPNFTLVLVFGAFEFGGDDDDACFAGGAKFVYVAIDAMNKANNSAKRFFNS